MNSDWFDENKLFSFKNLYVSFYINHSKIFPQIGNKEIVR